MIIAIVVLGVLLAISIIYNIRLYILADRLQNDKKLLWKAIHNTLKESREGD